MIKRIMLKDWTIAKMVKWDGSDESLKAIQELLPNVTVKRDDERPNKKINLYFGYRTEYSCTFAFNYIVLYPNGKVDIVDINWLNENTCLYANIFSIKKKYVYFVSGYVSFKNGERGFSNCEIEIDKKITRYEQINEIVEQIKNDDDEIDNYILLQYNLLRVEEEEEK